MFADHRRRDAVSDFPGLVESKKFIPVKTAQTAGLQANPLQMAIFDNLNRIWLNWPLSTHNQVIEPGCHEYTCRYYGEVDRMDKVARFRFNLVNIVKLSVFMTRAGIDQSSGTCSLSRNTITPSLSHRIPRHLISHTNQKVT